MSNRLPGLWSDALVNTLNQFQQDGQFGGFKCPNDLTDAVHVDYAATNGAAPGLLRATKYGWLCPACGHQKKRAYAEMA